MKGVIFDTDERERNGAFKKMFAESKISCWGLDDVKKYLDKGDYVFYYQRGTGIVGVGKVISDAIDEGDEQYCKVELLTPALRDYSEMRSVTPKEMKKILGCNICFKPTVKKPLIQSADKIKEFINRSRALYGLSPV